jgi:hypothetical protein
MESKLEDQIPSVPADFPMADVAGAVSGMHNKLLLTKYEGRMYQAGNTPPERYQRWLVFEDLAQKFCVKCLESKAGKRSHMSEVAILEQYLDRMLNMRDWGSARELRWTIRRTAELLGWPHPKSADD